MKFPVNLKSGHTAKPSLYTHLWRAIELCVPLDRKVDLRRLGQYVHSRHLVKSDSLLLSYPKSGSTWLRDMLATLYAGRVIDAADLAQWSPPLHLSKKSSTYSGRLIRSHDCIETPGFSRPDRTVVLVRDPRSLVVSWAFHRQRQGIELSIDASTDELLGNGFMSLGSWKSHIEGLQKYPYSSKLMIVRYEDLLDSTSESLLTIGSFLGLPESNELIELAVDAALPDSLRSRRVSAGLEEESAEISHIRSAKARAWEIECPIQCQNRISEQLELQLKFLGYTN